MVHMPAGVIQQPGDHPIAIAPVGARQLDDVVRQPFFVRCAAWSLALCRPMLPECAASPALGYAKGVPHMIDALATARRAQKYR